MFTKSLKLAFGMLCISSLIVQSNYAQSNASEQHIQNAMRLIAHKVLLVSEDSLSVIPPIEQNKNEFIISFNVNFSFEPIQLAQIIDDVILETEISKHYFVSVKNCLSNDIVYSYEKGKVLDSTVSIISNEDKTSTIFPCGGRVYPLDCYRIFILVDNVDKNDRKSFIDITQSQSNQSNINFWVLMIIIPLIIILASMILYKRSKKTTESNFGLISIGEFQFDKIQTELIWNGEKIELTSKEADLLSLLQDNVNSTVEKEFILQKVWGDEGDYVGRTLDVFISKLRKKLELDSDLKIVNVRGVGYKLVISTR